MVSEHHFVSFRDTLDRLPVSGIIRFIEMEKNMIESDFANGRIELHEDEFSILNFCRFIEAAVVGFKIPPRIVPVDHESFYREIVQRMVATRELPPYANRQFEMVFGGFPQQMAA